MIGRKEKEHKIVVEKETVRISNLFQSKITTHFQNVKEGQCDEDDIFSMTEGKHNADAADHGNQIALITEPG